MEGQPSNSPFRWHSECDDQLLQKCAFAKASGGCDIAATIIRPSLFMQDMTRRHFAPVIREEDTFYQLGKLDAAASARIGTEDHNVPMDYQDLYRIAMIDARDIAEVCACALTEPISAHANNTYIVTGPRALSWSDVAGAISNACGRGITATMLGDRAFFERFGRSHVYLKQMQAYRSGCGEDVDNDFEVVTGHRPRDIIEFALDHADAWK
ncbi:easG [Symbiodinium microadriaticum]|nr:easG [Symbiodinium microadriaticum]